MSPDDPRHGTTAGHLQHRLDGEQACAPCVAAKTRYEKSRHVYGDRMVPAIGTRRRIQALKAMGHSGADIAARIGVTYQAIYKLEKGTSEKIFARSAERIAAVYEEMSMTLPTTYHRTRIRNLSARLGYVPPLAWDDIDDPNEQPTDWRYRAATRAEQIADLDEQGATAADVCRALKITERTLEKWCYRHDLGATFQRLRGRERRDVA